MKISATRIRSRRWSLPLLLGALLLALGLTACGSSASSGPLTAAQVDGHSISLTTYQHIVNAYRALSAHDGKSVDWQSPTGRGNLAGAQSDALNFLINYQVARDELHTLGITVPQKDITTAAAALKKNVQTAVAQAPGDASMRAIQSALTDDVVAIFAEQSADQDALVSSTKVQVPTVHLRVIVTSKQSDAQSYLQQVQHGADFGKLAQQYSADKSTGASGGEVGTMYLGQLAATSPEFDKQFFNTAPTTNYKVKYAIVPASGSYILCEITQPANKPIAQLQDSQAQQTVFSAWINQLTQQAHVDRYVTAG